jgi:hypothetical protein
MRLAEKVFNLFCKSMSARALMICVNVGKCVTDTGTERWSERACMNTIMCPTRLSCRLSMISILVGESVQKKLSLQAPSVGRVGRREFVGRCA